MYYTVIKHSSHLRTLGKCRKHSPAARAFYISLVFSNACRVLSQCKTRLRLLYLLNNVACLKVTTRRCYFILNKQVIVRLLTSVQWTPNRLVGVQAGWLEFLCCNMGKAFYSHNAIFIQVYNVYSKVYRPIASAD